MCINKWTIHFWYLCFVLNFSDEFRSVFNQFKGLILWFNSFFSHPKKRKKAKVSVSRAWDYDPSLKSVNTIYNMLWDMLWETWNFIHLIKIHVNSYYWVELYRKAQFFLVSVVVVIIERSPNLLSLWDVVVKGGRKDIPIQYL